MLTNEILLEVYDGVTPQGGGWGCSSGCGPENSCGPTVEEATKELESRLQEVYGQTLIVMYIDTAKAGIKAYPQLSQVIQMGYGFPIVSVNGQPRFAGGIDLEQIREVIDETLAGK